MTYEAFRDPPYSARYGPLKTPVRVDVTYAGIIFALCILGFSFLVVIPGVRGFKKRVFIVIRIFLSMFIVACILLSLYGQEWEVASIQNVTTAYKAFAHQEIHADIGVNIGLKNVNITLKSIPINVVEGELKGERIDYNERFEFYGEQGLNGFGRFAGRIQRQFREAQWKGLPYPVLWIAEYFTLDGEGIRWGRYYRWGGFYTAIVLWLAFPLYLLAMILQFMVIRSCGLFLCMTGACMLSGNIIHAAMKYGAPLVIPFGGEADEQLTFSKGGSFWLCLSGGLVAVFYGLAVILFDEFRPNKTAEFFNVDPLIDYEDTFEPDKSIPGGDGQNGAPANLKPRYRPSRNPLFHKKNERKEVRSVVMSASIPEEIGEENHALEMKPKSSSDHDIRFRTGSRGISSTPSARDSVAFNEDSEIQSGAYVNTSAIKLNDEDD